jgi:formate hydrogenlyase subunit 6/NADH:ubiquinone oxidoreductase subunit I
MKNLMCGGTWMNGKITVDDQKCVGCNKCIRNCIVFDANVARMVEGENKVAVDSDKCVLCGKCIEVCDHEARGFTDDTEAFF